MVSGLKDIFLDALSIGKFSAENRKTLIYKWNKEIDKVQAIYNTLTSKNPNLKEVVQGKWVEDEDGVTRCSRCGNKALRNFYVNVQALSDFCPHCNADMRGVINDKK